MECEYGPGYDVRQIKDEPAHRDRDQHVCCDVAADPRTRHYVRDTLSCILSDKWCDSGLVLRQHARIRTVGMVIRHCLIGGLYQRLDIRYDAFLVLSVIL